MDTATMLKERYTKLSNHEKNISATLCLWSVFIACNEEPKQDYIETTASIASVMGLEWADVAKFYKTLDLKECLVEATKMDNYNIITMILNIFLLTANKLEKESNISDVYEAILEPLADFAEVDLNNIQSEL